MIRAGLPDVDPVSGHCDGRYLQTTVPALHGRFSDVISVVSRIEGRYAAINWSRSCNDRDRRPPLVRHPDTEESFIMHSVLQVLCGDVCDRLKVGGEACL